MRRRRKKYSNYFQFLVVVVRVVTCLRQCHHSQVSSYRLKKKESCVSWQEKERTNNNTRGCIPPPHARPSLFESRLRKLWAIGSPRMTNITIKEWKRKQKTIFWWCTKSVRFRWDYPMISPLTLHTHRSSVKTFALFISFTDDAAFGSISSKSSRCKKPKTINIICVV